MKGSLAIALSHHLELITMDEPTSALDPVYRGELLIILNLFITENIFSRTNFIKSMSNIRLLKVV